MTETPAQQNAGIADWVNTLMKGFLRAPVLHRLVSNKIMLITFTGRKSGKTYTTPVSYLNDGDTVLAFTHARWWQNCTGGAPVTVRIKGKDVRGSAEAIPDDKAAIAEALARHL